jgi:2,3-bisphosphoglycerate-independent phosphoglycerate mutase
LNTLLEESPNFDAFIINFANVDMVWHTGVLSAAIKAVETLDWIVAKLLQWSKDENVDILLTADHGNCEEMWQESQPKTSHTTNLVPFRYIHDWEPQDNIENEWWLADMAPTMLKLFGIDIPEEMTGHSLVK